MDVEPISHEESEALAEESRAARALDDALADDLGSAPPTGETSSAHYLRELGRRPAISDAEQHRLIEAAQLGDRIAREELVESHLPLIAGVARHYRAASRLSRVELIQEGVVGLLRGLERYDLARGVPFWGYAVWWVRQAMQQLVAEMARPLVLSDRSLRQLSRLQRAHREHLSRHGREPGGDDPAEATGLDHAQVAELMALERPPRSLEEPVHAGDAEVGAFGELLVDPLAPDAYEQLLDHSEIVQVRALLGSLNDRERAILRAHYGLGETERSLREIGEELGLSAERVRQIEARALAKLRAGVAGEP